MTWVALAKIARRNHLRRNQRFEWPHVDPQNRWPYLRAFKQFGNAAIFLNLKIEVSTHMVPKMMADKPQKMIVPQARVPAMQNLRDGGGSMKVMGSITPKMATPAPTKHKK